MENFIRKKRSLFILCAVLMAVSFVFAACGKSSADELPLGDVNEAPPEAASTDAADSGSPVEPGAELETEQEADELACHIPVIERRETVNGRMQSYLTGEWLAADAALRRPIAVMIPNNKAAMPQYGLSKAAIIYEAPVEGRITRLMAIFEDYDELDHIGPVRSSRDYFIYVAMGYEAIYCNWGLAKPYVEELINRDTVQNISAAVEGIHNPSDEAFGRIKRPGYATEFTGYLFMEGLKEAIERHDYETKYDKDYVPQFTFAAENYRAEYEDKKDAALIYPGGQTGNSGGYGSANPYFEYSEKDQLYYRFQDGSEQIDDYNKEQLAVSNVVLQYCHGEVRDAKDYLAFGVHGEGNALIFTNGKVIEATWKRYDGDATPARFYDKDDKEIVFNQGKTWICNIWEEYGEFVEYE